MFAGREAAKIGSGTHMHSREYAVGDLIAGSFRVLRIFGRAGASGMGVVYLVDERDAPEKLRPENVSGTRPHAGVAIQAGG